MEYSSYKTIENYIYFFICVLKVFSFYTNISDKSRNHCIFLNNLKTGRKINLKDLLTGIFIRNEYD